MSRACEFPGCDQPGAAVARPPELRAVEISIDAVPSGPSVLIACDEHRGLILARVEADRIEARVPFSPRMAVRFLLALWERLTE